MLKVATGRSQIKQTREKGEEAKEEREKLISPRRAGLAGKKLSWASLEITGCPRQLWPQRKAVLPSLVFRKPSFSPGHYSKALLQISRVLYGGLQTGGPRKFTRSMRAKVLGKSLSKLLNFQMPSAGLPSTSHLPFPTWTRKAGVPLTPSQRCIAPGRKHLWGPKGTDPCRRIPELKSRNIHGWFLMKDIQVTNL